MAMDGLSSMSRRLAALFHCELGLDLYLSISFESSFFLRVQEQAIQRIHRIGQTQEVHLGL